MTIISLSLAIANLIVDFGVKYETLIQTLLSPGVLTMLVAAIPSYITTIRDNKISKFIQIIIFFIIAAISVLVSDVASLADVNLIVFAIILCIQYDFLAKNFILKLVFILSFYTLYKFVILYFRSDEPVSYLIPSLIFTVFYLYLIWVAFAEEIKDYISQTKKLKQEIDKNEIFVEFGKNVTGVIHNLKNKIMAINSFNELMTEGEGDEIQEYSASQREIIDQTFQLIANLNFAVKSRQETEEKIISLGKIIKSVADLFDSNMKFHREVEIHMDLIEQDHIKISPLEASQLLENLIRNSWEAMRETDKNNLFMKTEQINDQIKFTIRDEGGGIPFCDNCDHRNCRDCNHFKIGKTTKEYGTGVGMVFIQTLMRNIDGKMSIYSKMNEGTTIELYFKWYKRNNSDYLVE